MLTVTPPSTPEPARRNLNGLGLVTAARIVRKAGFSVPALGLERIAAA
jgi:hypothetical protein